MSQLKEVFRGPLAKLGLGNLFSGLGGGDKKVVDE